MNENKDDRETYLQCNVVKFEGKPNIYKMSADNIRTGSRDNHESNGSRDSESSEIDQSAQNLGVKIKEEPDTNDTRGNSSCDTGFIGQLYDHSSDNTEMRDLDVHSDTSIVFSDGTDYAVCLKYEANLCETIEPVAPVNYVNSRKPDYHDTPDNTGNRHCHHENPDNGHSFYANPDDSHCNVDCKPAPDGLQNQNTEMRYGTKKCEIPEHPIQENTERYNDIDSSVHNNHYLNHKCSISNEKINSLDKNDSSTERKRTTEKEYKCDICIDSITMPYHAETKYQKYIEKKLCKRTGQKPYKCDVCSYSAARSIHLVQHKRKHTGEKPHKCDVCNFRTAWPGDLVRHKRKHTGHTPYKCDSCSYSTDRSVYLARHKRKCTGEKPFKCEVCTYCTARSSDLAMHKIKHTRERPYKRDVPMSYEVSEPYVRSGRDKQNDQIRHNHGTQDKSQYYENCSHTSNCSGDVLKRAYIDKKLDICSFSSEHASSLSKHKHKHTGEKPYKCNKCSFSTACSKYLAKHKRIHTKEKQYKCDICSYICITARDLEVHKRIHTGEKTYKCDMCSYSTVSSFALAKHTGECKGKKSHKCDICNYSAASFTSLSKHKRQHTREIPYKCDICSFSFLRSGDLAKHKRKHLRDYNASSVVHPPVRPSGLNISISDFSSETAERSSTKLYRNQDPNVYQVYVGRVDRKI